MLAFSAVTGGMCWNVRKKQKCDSVMQQNGAIICLFTVGLLQTKMAAMDNKSAMM